MNFTPNVKPVKPAPVVPAKWVPLIRRLPAPRNRKLLAFALASHADFKTGYAHPGHARLAADTGLSVSTVRREMAWLLQAGLICLVKRGTRKLREADEYVLSDPGGDLVPSEAFHDAVVQAIAENRSGQISTAHKDEP